MVVAGRFRVEAEVGAGSAGVVYRARDELTGEVVALKLFHGATGDGEAALLARLGSPAVARLIAHGRTPAGRRWLASEWIDGETLAERLERGPLTVEETAAVARRVAGALAAIHRLGAVHGDLKPGNVILEGGEAAAARLIDAGGGGLGTLGYQAPEGGGGARADVFALGQLIAACLPPGGGPLRALAGELSDPDPRRRPEDGEAVLRALGGGGPVEERVVAVVVGRASVEVVGGRDLARRARARAGPGTSVALVTGRSHGGAVVPDAALVAAARARIRDGEIVVDEDISRLTAPRHEGSFGGRDRELARLDDALAAGRPIVVTGSAGIGKSRLLVELVRRAGPAAAALVVDDVDPEVQPVPPAIAAARRFPEAWAGGEVEELRLAPLTRRAAVALGFSAGVITRAGGNPFFLEELQRSPGELPLTVRALLEEKLDALGAEARQAVRDGRLEADDPLLAEAVAAAGRVA